MYMFHFVRETDIVQKVHKKATLPTIEMRLKNSECENGRAGVTSQSVYGRHGRCQCLNALAAVNVRTNTNK